MFAQADHQQHAAAAAVAAAAWMTTSDGGAPTALELQQSAEKGLIKLSSTLSTQSTSHAPVPAPTASSASGGRSVGLKQLKRQATTLDEPDQVPEFRRPHPKRRSLSLSIGAARPSRLRDSFRRRSTLPKELGTWDEEHATTSDRREGPEVVSGKTTTTTIRRLWPLCRASLKSLWRVGHFWLDFILYQLETWLLLVRQVRLARTHPAEQQMSSLHAAASEMSAMAARGERPTATTSTRRRPMLSGAERSQSLIASTYCHPHTYNHRPAHSANYNSSYASQTRPPRQADTLHRDHWGVCGAAAADNNFHRRVYEDQDHPAGVSVLLNSRAYFETPPPERAHADSMICQHGGRQHYYQYGKMNTVDVTGLNYSNAKRRAPLVNQLTLDTTSPPMAGGIRMQQQYSTSSSGGSQHLLGTSSQLAVGQFCQATLDNNIAYDSMSLYERRMLDTYRSRQVTTSDNHYASHRPPLIRPSSSSSHHHHHQAGATRFSGHRSFHLAAGARTNQFVQCQTIGSDSELNFQPRHQQQHSINYGHSSQFNARSGGPLATQPRPDHVAGQGGVQAERLSRQASISYDESTDTTDFQLGQNQELSYQTTNKVGKNKKASKLSLEGAKKRLGFKQDGLSQISIQRSEEVLPLELELERRLVQDLTIGSSLNDMSISKSSDSPLGNSHFHWSLSSDPKNLFIEGLGPGQIVSRQALVSPYIGELKLALCNRHGALELNVIRARRLQLKLGTNLPPSPYVKVYLIKDRKCIAKWKTTQAAHTLEPEYRQSFIYRGDHSGCAVQVIVWGDYGRRDRKSFMGIVQIQTDNLQLASDVMGWYKLFNAPSMINLFNSSKQMRRQMLPLHHQSKSR